MEWQSKINTTKMILQSGSHIYENKELCSWGICTSLQKAKLLHKTVLKVLREKWENRQVSISIMQLDAFWNDKILFPWRLTGQVDRCYKAQVQKVIQVPFLKIKPNVENNKKMMKYSH